MGKDGPMTAKAIANKIKAKGLQKLQWYCQMCEKQCRDANGFKCHTQSESHQRMMSLFADNAKGFIDQFSEEFLEQYMSIVRHRHRTTRVNANQVYNDLVNDRGHIHMNSTKWESLTDFVKYLGREGLCEVDLTPKGWFIKYIDRDPATLARQAALAKKARADKSDEDRNAQLLQKQIALSKANTSEALLETTAPTELKRDEGTGKIKFGLASKGKSKRERPAEGRGEAGAVGSAADARDSKVKVARQGDAPWLQVGIIVKIVNKKVDDGKYYKTKGSVVKVLNDYVGDVECFVNGKVRQFDQKDLETVLPAEGKDVVVVRGPHRRSKGILERIDKGKYQAYVKLGGGDSQGQTIPFEYDDVCKVDKEKPPQ